MRLKAIAKLVKQAGVLQIWDGGEWIGIPEAMYANPVPGLDSDQILRVLDFSEKESEKITILQCGTSEGAGVSLEDRPKEAHTEWPRLQIKLGPDEWLPFQDREGRLHPLRADLLKPMADSREELEVSVRYTAGLRPYLVISTGWIVQAMIWPGDPAKLIEELERLTRAVRVDPATGEVV